MSCFRLFDLPLDLLELLTLYFEGSEAVKVLTASSNFHEIFARSVWRTITITTIRVAKPTRSRAFARYGHLVRSIDLFNKLHLKFSSYKWTQLFPNTTSLEFSIYPSMEDDVKQTFMDAIAGLHGLRSLEIYMDSNMPPFDLETLARMSVARHRDPNKQSLRKLTVIFHTRDGTNDYGDEEKLWSDLSSFVQALSSLRPSINLQIDLSGYGCVMTPTPAQVDIPRPYLIGAPSLGMEEDEDECMALYNRQFFSPSDTRDDPLVFGKLERLNVRLCCASSVWFDYSDFTPVKFPAVEWMDIAGVKCSHQTEEGATSAIQTLLTQKWPMLSRLDLDGDGLTLGTLDSLIELNPQLTSLLVDICCNTDGTDSVFMLERVAGRLPHLTTFYLYSGSAALVDSNWLQATSLVDIRSSKLTSVTIAASILASRLFEVLLTLPRLRSVSFWECVLAEPELVMNVFKKHRQTAKENAKMGIIDLTLNAPQVNNNWSAELVLEMIASLSHLKSCTIYGHAAIKNAVREKHPHIRL
ncbi:hypothetical protein GQ42DRAFT_160190 [Ramicandelaber brevisporus]|nr:hypothetical protein GQ42DRAFT_160190 [Ramicandelaber brevisporus]